MSLDLKLNVDEINLSEVKPSPHSVYGFEGFRLDAEHLMLYRNGDEISLTPKQVDTLLVLVENGGEIVSKDVLMTRLWGNTAVEESNLVQNIHFLRKVLGETSDGRPMIETLRRRGYRFNAEVTSHKHRLAEVSDAIRLSELNEIPKPATPVRRVRSDRRAAPVKISRTRAIAAISGGVLFIAVVATVFFLGGSTTIDVTNKKIAILPLTPIDPANRNILYEMGIADSLIRRLNPAKGLNVRSLNSVRKYNEAEPDPLEAGRELKVDYVVESNYQLSDGQIKVTSQIMEVSTGKLEGTYTASADAGSIILAQEAITKDIGNRLLARFGSRAVEAPTARGTDNEEAYASYLMAMNLSEERGIQSVLKCLEYLEQAVALDPNYARAWASIALTHGDLIGHSDSDQQEHYQRGMEAIAKALAIDPNLPAAFTAQCNFKNRYEYNAVEAETACKHALELDSNSPVAHKIYANFLYSQGRFDEAVSEINKAMEIQPVSYRNQQIYGLTLFFARRYPEAEAQFKHLLDLNPKHNYINKQLVTILELQGKESEAFGFLIDSLVLDGKDARVIQRYKDIYSKGGWRGVTIERIKTGDVETVPGDFKTACLYARLGDKDKAFGFLEKAFRKHSFQIAVLKVQPQLDSLRDDPRYIDLVQRVENQIDSSRQ